MGQKGETVARGNSERQDSSSCLPSLVGVSGNEGENRLGHMPWKHHPCRENSANEQPAGGRVVLMRPLRGKLGRNSQINSYTFFYPCSFCC